MVGRSRKSKSGGALAGSHQRCWIWGRNAVLETLRAGRWRPLEIIAAERLDDEIMSEVHSLAAASRIRLNVAPFDTLTGRCRSVEHQGLIAKMPEFPYADLEACLTAAPEGSERAPLLVILDSIQDPFNFGAILRSAEVFGAAGIVVGRQNQSNITPHVSRSSAGAVNHLPVARVSDLVEAVKALQSRGYAVIGAAGESDREVTQIDLRRPIALVIGNEGAGLAPDIRGACDELVRIPQIGRTESLNAAVAAGILCYEVQRQRN
jgi:23S rRNA (guanosine2251-2'-O)-methyltransferase